MAKQLQSARTSAFNRQNGCCFYCGFAMWQDNPKEFAKQHGLTAAQARHFQCTAEHLVARQDGGSNARQNIAAACLICNSRRHKRSGCAPAAEQYRAMVVKRVMVGGWLPFRPKPVSENRYQASNAGQPYPAGQISCGP